MQQRLSLRTVVRTAGRAVSEGVRASLWSALRWAARQVGLLRDAAASGLLARVVRGEAQFRDLDPDQRERAHALIDQAIEARATRTSLNPAHGTGRVDPRRR